MFGRHTYIGIVLVAVATLVFSQSNQAQAPDFKTGSATKALSSAMAASAHEHEGNTPGAAEILTDTRGVDFSPYMATVKAHSSQSLEAHDSFAGAIPHC